MCAYLYVYVSVYVCILVEKKLLTGGNTTGVNWNLWILLDKLIAEE